MYTAQAINLKTHINQNNCTENQAKQKRVNFLNVYLQFKVHKTFALTAKKGLWQNIWKLAQYSYENIYLGQMHAQSGLGLTFIDWDQAWTTCQHNIYWFDLVCDKAKWLSSQLHSLAKRPRLGHQDF